MILFVTCLRWIHIASTFGPTKLALCLHHQPLEISLNILYTHKIREWYTGWKVWYFTGGIFIVWYLMLTDAPMSNYTFLCNLRDLLYIYTSYDEGTIGSQSNGFMEAPWWNHSSLPIRVATFVLCLCIQYVRKMSELGFFYMAWQTLIDHCLFLVLYICTYPTVCHAITITVIVLAL